MEPDQATSLQHELLKIKKGLKDWEYTFFKRHERKPTIKDIQDRPKVERVYKDYNTKKKQLRQLSVDLPDSQTLSQPVVYDSQAQSSSQQSRSPSFSQKRRRSSQASVEYIRSPSHRLSRMKYVDHLDQPATSLDFASCSNTTSTTTTTTASSKATDEDSFWLGSSSSSASKHQSNATLSNMLFSSTDDSTTKKNQKRKKKSAALEQRLFGHLIWKPRDTLGPALKAERDATADDDDDDDDDEQEVVPDLIVSSTPEPVATSSTTTEDLTIDGLIITERELDPFRHFDPTLRHADNDDFVMPGLFASSRARSTIMAPMMKDDLARHQRIMKAIRLGTLGEKRPTDDDMDDDLKRFMDENTDCLAEDDNNDTPDQLPTTTYRKKFTQKRQTKLHKFRYVET